MTAYYNEIDPYCAAWLRNLMDAGHIPAGRIDTRSIEDVRPDELAGYTQCHFFAGIGGWSLALRLARWPDDKPVWTGSCPCQPFSSAGKGAGFEDERHLWPAWQHLIEQCKPPVIFGEQVASKAVDPWIDLVHADMEGMGYAFGGIAFPAAGIGAPHIRDRTYWLGHADDARSQGHAGHGGAAGRQGPERPAAEAGVSVRVEHATGMRCDGRSRRAQESGRELREPVNGPASETGSVADADRGQCDGIAVVQGNERNGEDAGRSQGIGGAAACCDVLGLANATRSGRREEREDSGRFDAGDRSQGIAARPEHGGSDHRAGPTNGQWADADWLFCTDGKWRPVEPGTFPLAHGIPSRVGRLRAYGNAIVPAQAAEFITAYVEARSARFEHGQSGATL